MFPMYSIVELLRLRTVEPGKSILRQLQKTPEIARIPAANRAAIEKYHTQHDIRTSSDESTHVMVTLPQATEWHYRGRIGHEHSAPQPLSAPSGLAAQKDEGFQKFYKAVASPTHVRVTAGGRIVPNTRSPQSPNVKKESASEQTQSQAQQNAHANVPAMQEAPQQTATPVSVPLGYPAAYAAYPAGMFAHAQFPFPHIPMGFNLAGGFSLPHFATNRRVSDQPEGLAPQATAHAQGLDGAGGVRVSPPEQFDPTRPCFVNGQWMLPMGAQAYPYGLHPFMPQSGLVGNSGGNTTPQGPMPSQASSYSNLESQSARSNGNHASTPPSAPSHPPISSIRPSQITKCHIESLKYNLKRVEDQLQYNVHQIDVKHMEGLAAEIRASIKALKDALPKQLEFESLHYPKSEKQDSKPNGELFNPPISNSAGPRDHVGQNRRNGIHARTGVNVTNGIRPNFSTGSGLHRSGSTDSEPLRRFSGLPMAAAAAAPFKPSDRHATAKYTVRSGDDFVESKEVARDKTMGLGGSGFQNVTMNLAGRQKESSGDQVKALAKGSANSSAHGAKAVESAVTPKSTSCAVVSPPASLNQRDGDEASEESKTVRIRRQEDRFSRKGNDLWLSMLKKGSPGSNALPGEVTSTTAQGYLPVYGGHAAAASLAPTIANTNSSQGSMRKASGSEDRPGNVVSAGENCPPIDGVLADTQRAVCH